MALTQVAVTVGATPTLLASTPGYAPLGVTVENADSQTIYVGDSAVTPATGIPVAPSASFPAQLAGATGDSIYGVVASGTAVAIVFKNTGGLPPVAPIGGALGVQKVTAGFLAQGQTAQKVSGAQATSTTVTTTVPLWTVTAGKTAYLTDISLYSDSAALLAIQLRAATVPLQRFTARDLAPVQLPGIETPTFGTSGQALDLLLPITAAIVNVYYNVQGFEQ